MDFMRPLLVISIFLLGLGGQRWALAQVPSLVIPAMHREDIYALTMRPDRRVLVSAGGSELRFWEFATGRLLRAVDLTGQEVFTNDISSIAFDPAGKTLAAISGSRLYLLDAQTFELLHSEDLTRGILTKKYETRSSRYAVGVMAAHPTQKAFYYQARYDTLHALFRYDIATQKTTTVSEWRVNAGPTRTAKRITWSPDGRKALVAYFTADRSVVVDLASGKAEGFEGYQYWLPDGTILRQENSPKGLILGAMKEDGTAAWVKQVPGLVLKAGQFEQYDRHYANLDVDPASGEFFYGLRDSGYISGSYRNGEGFGYGAKPGDYLGSALLALGEGRLLVTAKDPVRLAEADVRSGRIVREFGSELLAVTNLATSVKTLRAGIVSNTLTAKLIELTPRGINVRAGGPTAGGYYLATSPNGGFSVAEIKGEGAVQVLDATNGSARRVNIVLAKAYALDIDDEGNFVVQGPEGVAYYAAGSSTPSWQAAGKNHPLPNAQSYEVHVSPDGELIIAIDYERTSPVTDDLNLIAYEAKSGKERWRKVTMAHDLTFTPDGKELIGTGYYTELLRIDAKNGKELSRVKRPGEPYRGLSLDATATRLATASRRNKDRTDETIEIRHVPTQALQVELAGHEGTIAKMGFLADDLFLSAGFDNTLRLWDLRTGKELAKLFLFEKTNDWVVLTPDGRFDATQAAMKQLYYTVGTQIVPLEQYYEGFFTPGLLGQLMARNPVLITPPVRITAAARPPTVRLDYSTGGRNLTVEDDDVATIRTIETSTPKAVLILRATAPGSTVAELRLYHNGKLLESSTTRNLVVEDEAPSNPGEPQRRYTVTLLAGANDFLAVALNAERTESRPSELRVVYAASAKTEPVVATVGARLHLVTVGINAYKNPKYNLNYAEADAGGIEKALSEGLKRVVSGVETYTIRNAGATRADILATIAKVTAAAGPEDVFVFYYAGHGVMSAPVGATGTAADFYLVPYDVTQLYGDEAGLAARGISATELKALAAGIPAQKQLYILDACQSAGAVDNIVSRGAAEEKAIAQLARSTGTHWLTASGSEQFANEFDQLGHGAFTYALLEALGGKAAGDDGRVSVNELKAYLDVAVPELTEKFLGQAQYPASYGYGQDFPVSVVE